MLDRTKTLTEIENDDWGKPTFGSHLVTTCHQMRYKPIGELSADEIRTAIGQGFSLETLMPLALEHLQRDPLLDATFYEGDLLKYVLAVEPGFWAGRPDLWMQAAQIAEQAQTRMNDRADELGEYWFEEIAPDIQATHETFLASRPQLTDPSSPEMAGL